MSNCSDLYNFNYKQEHGLLQMFGPANGVGNYLALEKIYCMLILRIRAFSPPELQGQKNYLKKGRGEVMGTPGLP